MLTRKTVVLAKIEANYGVDPVPTVGADALLVKDVDIKPTGETLTRDYIRSSLSPLQFLRGIREVEVGFTTELKGTGARGALPAFGWEGPLFRACGFSEVVNAGVSIVYAPVSASFESCTLYVYKDGIFHKVTGCRGTCVMTFEIGKFPTVKWTFKGIYVSPADSSPAAQTFSDVEPPVILGTVLTVGGYGPCVEKLEISLNNNLAPRKCMSAASGITEWLITGRDPNGSFDPEAVLEATEDFWAKWESAEAFALALGPIGSDAGNIIEVDAPAMQYKEIAYGDRNGLLTYQIPFGLAMNTGDDELQITIT